MVYRESKPLVPKGLSPQCQMVLYKQSLWTIKFGKTDDEFQWSTSPSTQVGEAPDPNFSNTPPLCTPCLRKKVAHHTLRNTFAQGWPNAKISTTTESEIISEHKCIINVLIFNVLKCCHLACIMYQHVSNWHLCMHKNCTYFEGLRADRILPICWFALENNSFYCSKCYYRTFAMFRAQNFSCSINDWDTWFYSAYVVASELPGPQSRWLLCLECTTRTCLLLHQGWQSGRIETAHRGWMGSSRS